MTVLAIGTLSACSTTGTVQPEAPRQTIPTANSAEVRFPIRSLDANSAQALAVSEKDKFASLAALASQRPQVRQEIGELELGILAGDEPGEKVSQMRFSVLPMGLDFYSHTAKPVADRPDFGEAGIGLFGLGTAVYWNSRFPYPNGIVAEAPAQLRLLKGRLFSADTSFTLEINEPSMEAIVQECSPVESISAQNIHASLTGRATIFGCKTGDASNAKFWYLEDYARYISYDISYDGSSLSKARIKNVKFR